MVPQEGQSSTVSDVIEIIHGTNETQKRNRKLYCLGTIFLEKNRQAGHWMAVGVPTLQAFMQDLRFIDVNMITKRKTKYTQA